MRYFLDANIFLRFLTADDRKKAEECLRLVRLCVEGKLELFTHSLILAEVVWVLESYYRLPRDEISEKLNQLLSTPNLKVEDKDTFARAVAIYESGQLDLADCLSAAIAEGSDIILVSYDLGFNTLESITRLEPSEVLAG